MQDLSGIHAVPVHSTVRLTLPLQATRAEQPDLKLIQPCLCSGTQAHVHTECLEKWRSVSDGPGQHSCTTCGHKYRKKPSSSLRALFWQGIADGATCSTYCAAVYALAVAAVGCLLCAADAWGAISTNLPLGSTHTGLCYDRATDFLLGWTIVAIVEHFFFANLLVATGMWGMTMVLATILLYQGINEATQVLNNMGMLAVNGVSLANLLIQRDTDYDEVMWLFSKYFAYPLCAFYHAYPLPMVWLRVFGMRKTAKNVEYLEPSMPAEENGAMLAARGIGKCVLAASLSIVVAGVLGSLYGSLCVTSSLLQALCK